MGRPVFQEDDDSSPAEVMEFGRYEIRGRLGRGAMGTVYRAYDPELQREIALKLLPSSILASQGELGRLKREAKAAAGIDHPNVVTVFEAGEIDDQPFLSMQLVEGGPLSDFEQSIGGDHRKVAALVAKVARAVHAAHGRGILHRDLKPGNILVDSASGEPFVADFGIAKILDNEGDEEREGPQLTLTGQILGTPDYMSPEQAGGDRLGQASDVYSLGAILYRLLTGQLPIRGSTTMEILRNVSEHIPERPMFLSGKPDADLEAIVMKCLEKHPAHRYDSAAALADDLENWRRGDPIRARKLTGPERMIRWMKRKPVHATALGLAVAFLLTLAVGGPLVALNQKRLTETAVTAEADAMAQRGKAERSAEEFRRSLYRAEMRIASQAVNEPGGLTVIENLTSKWADAGELIGWEWHHLRRQLDQPFETLATSSSRTNGELDINTDGTILAAKLEKSGPVTLFDSRSGESILVFEETNNWNSTTVRFYPDDSRILIGAEHPQYFGVYSTEDGREIFSGGSGKGVGNEMAITPDGRFVIQATLSRVRVLDATDGRVITEKTTNANPASLIVNPADPHQFLAAGWKGTVLRGRFDPEIAGLTLETVQAAGVSVAVWEMDWSQDGKRFVLVNTPDFAVSVLDADTFDPVWTSENSSGPLHAVSYSPDDRYIATGGEDRSIRIYEADSGNLLSTLRGHTATVYQLSWSPDGTRLYSASVDQSLRTWDVSRMGETLAFSTRNFSTHGLTWGPDGGMLFACNGVSVNAWILPPDGDQTPAYSLPNISCGEVALHPDGERIAAATHGHLRIHSIRDGKELQSINLVESGVFPEWRFLTRIRWSPDGSRIALSRNFSEHVHILEKDLRGPGMSIRAITVADKIFPWCWTPDGTAILSVYNGTRLLQHSLDGEIWQLRAETTEGILDLSFDPKGRWLALAGENVIELRRSDSFELLRTMVGHSSRIHQVAWAPDGRRLASLEQSGTIGIWDPESGEAVAMLESPNGKRFTAISWSPDGRVLAAGDSSAGVRLLE